MQKLLLRLPLKLFISKCRIIIMLVIFSLLFVSNVLMAQTVETVTTLSDSRLLNAAYELHITSSDEPVEDGVVVSLNHPDAWVFFDNMKPSVVSENHLDHIQVNG
ncbi:MAG: hypothetical protein LC643_02565, partial [Bacteroidales bacterium]|nr:hypothetical protein [Bacteroidales bacterium]